MLIRALAKTPVNSSVSLNFLKSSLSLNNHTSINNNNKHILNRVQIQYKTQFFSTTMKAQAFKKFHFNLPADGKYDLIPCEPEQKLQNDITEIANDQDNKCSESPVTYTIDKSQFVVKIPLVAVVFSDPRNISLLCKSFKKDVFNCERLTNIVKLSADTESESANSNKKQVFKGVLLKEEIDEVNKVDQLLEPETLKFLKENQCSFKPYTYVLDYDFWKVEEILSRVLPPGLNNPETIPSSYTSTGHIAHVNLKAEYKPYGEVIGQIILDKNQPKIQMVVDKLDSINTKFRTFAMKILASAPSSNTSFEVTHKESNCFFTFDFSKVYWNSRLHTEHDRLIAQVFQPGEVVGDVFAGVGPFSVPAGKKKVIVMSNDLNPSSFEYMKRNISTNKVSKFVEPLNLDGGEFITNCLSILNKYISKHPNGEIKMTKNIKVGKELKTIDESIKIPNYYNHFVMNLPELAITFLHNFIGIYSTTTTSTTSTTSTTTTTTNTSSIPQDVPMPYIHVHCFEKYSPDEASTITDEEIHSRVHQRIVKELGLFENEKYLELLPLQNLKFHLVRKVAPTKPMFCVSFQLPREVAFASKP